MKKQSIKITKSTQNKTISIENMSVYEMCRWASLKEAVDIIAEKCEDRKIDFNEFDLKPLDILKFVDTMTDDLYNKVLNENKTNEQTRA